MGILLSGLHLYSTNCSVFGRYSASRLISCLVTLSELLTVYFIVSCLADYTVSLPNFLYHSYDGPNCPPGYTFFNTTNFCYKSHVAVLRHIRDRKVCLNEYAELTSIHSEVENNFVIALTRAAFPSGKEQQTTKHRITIGLLYYHGDWRWFDGSEIVYTNFMKDMPFLLDNEMYTSIVMDADKYTGRMSKEWKTELSYHKNYFVCKMKPLTGRSVFW